MYLWVQLLEMEVGNELEIRYFRLNEKKRNPNVGVQRLTTIYQLRAQNDVAHLAYLEVTFNTGGPHFEPPAVGNFLNIAFICN